MGNTTLPRKGERRLAGGKAMAKTAGGWLNGQNHAAPEGRAAVGWGEEAMAKMAGGVVESAGGTRQGGEARMPRRGAGVHAFCPARPPRPPSPLWPLPPSRPPLSPPRGSVVPLDGAHHSANRDPGARFHVYGAWGEDVCAMPSCLPPMPLELQVRLPSPDAHASPRLQRVTLKQKH